MALSAKSVRELNSQLDVSYFKIETLVTQIKSLYQTSLILTIDSVEVKEFKIKYDSLESNYSSFSKINLEIIKLNLLTRYLLFPSVFP